jgi:hypothetical protein
MLDQSSICIPAQFQKYMYPVAKVLYLWTWTIQVEVHNNKLKQFIQLVMMIMFNLNIRTKDLQDAMQMIGTTIPSTACFD